MSSDEQPVDYKTHILIGVRPNGIMTVIAELAVRPTSGRSSGADRRDAGKLRHVRARHADVDHARKLSGFFRSALEIVARLGSFVTGPTNVHAQAPRWRSEPGATTTAARNTTQSQFR